MQPFLCLHAMHLLGEEHCERTQKTKNSCVRDGSVNCSVSVSYYSKTFSHPNKFYRYHRVMGLTIALKS